MKSTKEILNKADAEIMEVVYEWAEINFDVEGWAQDSTQIRDILKTTLQAHEEALKKDLVGQIGAKLLARRSSQAVLDAYFDVANELLEASENEHGTTN